MLVDGQEIKYSDWRSQTSRDFTSQESWGDQAFSTSSGLNPGDNAKGYRFGYVSKEYPDKIFSPIAGGGVGRVSFDRIEQDALGRYDDPGAYLHEAQSPEGGLYYFPAREEAEDYMRVVIRKMSQLEKTGPAPYLGKFVLFEVEGTEGVKPTVVGEDAGAVMSTLHYVKPVIEISIDEIGRYDWEPGSMFEYQRTKLTKPEEYIHPSADEW